MVRARGRVRVPPLCRSGGLVSCSGLVRFSEGVGGFVCSASSCWAPSSPVWLGFGVFGGTAMDVLAAVWWSLFPCCLCATVLVLELWWAVYDLFLVFSDGGSSSSPSGLCRTWCLSATVYCLWCSSVPVRQSCSPALPRWRSFGEVLWS